MTAPAAQLCPQCLAANVIATAGGPSCTHQQAHGVKWWPADWDRMGEAGRVVWIEQRNTQNRTNK